MEYIISSIVAFSIIAAIHGWFSDKSTKVREDEFNRNTRKQLAEQKRQFDASEAEAVRRLQLKVTFIAEAKTAFDESYIAGRKWLAHFIAEADKSLDESIVSYLKFKKRPALKSAEEVSIARAEKRLLKEQLKFLEYQLKSYKEYFPFLEEYEEIILDEAVVLSDGDTNLDAIENSDPVLLYVPKAEYEKLSITNRNQLALDRYLNRPFSKAAICRFYERFLGYQYERDGWDVEYHGIIEGFEDLGRDLICTKGNKVAIVQAKCWSAQKTIHEKHIFQLFGTTQLYLMNKMNNDLFSKQVSPVFVTSTTLSPVARQAANWLKIQVRESYSLDKNYPMIKCNISKSNKEKIYHLPFDQQYDRTVITPKDGEFYALTVEEAEREGFRRAFRFMGNG